jgi:putative transcriptional regulator
MEKRLFNEFLKSVRQGGQILRGERKPSRVTRVDAAPSVQAIRSKLELSQAEFAAMLGVPKRTIQNWEQGIRKPQGPAKALLTVAAKRPDAVLDALHPHIPKAKAG